MPIQYLSHLSSEKRDRRSDLHLGCVLAFVAGAVNAGGFLAIGGYTSHMTGIVSGMADDLALGNVSVALAALAAWLAFISGAATTAVLINWARRRRLRSQYALSLLLEALLLLIFGVAGTYLAALRDILAPVTVLLLCYIMGLQNAIITKISGAVIRTTHITGMSTDIGIELGKLFYYNRKPLPELVVRANRQKLKMHALLILFFFTGGITGALGFKHIGYSATIFLAAALAMLAAGPIAHDIRLLWRYHRRQS
ncbi:YoaK family protein [Janthinobacterium sp.]|uniref:YoaK family protein n=1 Tax=Janthinobacterium sp. TaxID=1871054 RepID=UPI00293D50DC|nr:YoaK family protein [Janthinobacterium sp.]